MNSSRGRHRACLKVIFGISTPADKVNFWKMCKSCFQLCRVSFRSGDALAGSSRVRPQQIGSIRRRIHAGNHLVFHGISGQWLARNLPPSPVYLFHSFVSVSGWLIHRILVHSAALSSPAGGPTLIKCDAQPNDFVLACSTSRMCRDQDGIWARLTSTSLETPWTKYEAKSTTNFGFSTFSM